MDTRGDVSLIVALAQPMSLHYISFITFNAAPVTLLSARVIACFARAWRQGVHPNEWRIGGRKLSRWIFANRCIIVFSEDINHTCKLHVTRCYLDLLARECAKEQECERNDRWSRRGHTRWRHTVRASWNERGFPTIKRWRILTFIN